MNGDKDEGEDGGDVESQGLSEESKARPRACTRRIIVLSILTSFAILAGSATVSFWPRDVDWELTQLDVMDESSLMYFVMAFGNVQNDTILPELGFHAGALVQNPNLLGGRAASGDFQVLYSDQLLGSGHSEPVAIPALGSGTVEAKIRIKLSPALFNQLTADILQHSLHATVKIKGAARVKSIFGLQLHCKMDCDIHASVTEILGEEKQAVVQNKTCRYNYF
eukprot:Skav204461  [mRNA]  locus=scaffold3299:65183:65851:+ [translate_table: standard]